MPYELISENIYTVIFVGLLFGGETILLPAMYFGISGTISLQAIIGISILATAISDTFWYYLGRTTPVEKISSLKIFRKYTENIAGLSSSFKKNGLFLLFSSKFVYGTRTTMQILCGMNNITFVKYFFINISGIVALNAFFLVLGITIKESFVLLAESPFHLLLALGTFALCVIIFHILFKKLIWEKWSPQ